MDSKLKNKLKNAPFVIDGDAGEKYYQIHIFEDADGLNFLQISSKINKNGKIEVFSRASREGLPFTATINKPSSKEEFQKAVNFLKNALEEKGFIHRFIDLSQCKDAVEVMNLMKKTEPRFQIEIRHKSALE